MILDIISHILLTILAIIAIIVVLPVTLEVVSKYEKVRIYIKALFFKIDITQLKAKSDKKKSDKKKREQQMQEQYGAPNFINPDDSVDYGSNESIYGINFDELCTELDKELGFVEADEKNQTTKTEPEPEKNSEPEPEPKTEPETHKPKQDDKKTEPKEKVKFKFDIDKVDDYLECLSDGLDILDGLAFCFTIKKLDVDCQIQTKDCAKTGYTVGLLWAVYGNVIPFLKKSFIVKSYNINFRPNWNDEMTKIRTDAHIILYTSIFRVLTNIKYKKINEIRKRVMK